MKIRAVLLAVLVLTPALAGCSRQALKLEEELIRAIQRTENLPAKFVYREQTTARKVEVRGLVEDDLRYKTRLLIDTAPAYEEVVSDDVVASRFLDPSKIEMFANPNPPPPPSDEVLAPGEQPKLRGRRVVEALRARRWVVDLVGAPNLLVASTSKNRKIGDDPVVDSLTIFDYLETAARQAIVTKFNPDSLDYREKEDPFAKIKPRKSKGEIRYDLVRPGLPKADEAATNSQAIPGARHFRFMSIFVTKGKVTRVLEKIQVTGKLLEKFEKYSRAFIKSKLPQFLAEYDKAAKSLKGLPEAQRGAFFIAGLNENLRTSGVEPIRLRSMTLDLKDLGGDIRVTLPDPAKDQTLMGDLSILQNRGEGAGRAVPEVVPGSNPTEGGSPPGEAPTIGEAPIGGAVPPGGETPAGGETPPEGATTTITEPPPVG